MVYACRHAFADFPHEDEQVRDDVDAEQGGDDHTEEDSDTERVSRRRACAGGDHQGDDAEDEGEGRHEDRADTFAAGFDRGLFDRLACVALFDREFHHQDGVLGFEADDDEQTDVEVEVIGVPEHEQAEEGAEDAERHTDHDRDRRGPAFVLCGEDEERHHQAKPEHDATLSGRQLFLVGLAAEPEADAHRAVLVLDELLGGIEHLAGALALTRRADHEGRREAVEAADDRGAGAEVGADERADGHHHTGGAPHVELADVLGPLAEGRLRFDLHVVRLPVQVEVIDVVVREHGLERREDIGQRDAQ
jgi:hypothetical protein